MCENYVGLLCIGQRWKLAIQKCFMVLGERQVAASEYSKIKRDRTSCVCNNTVAESSLIF